MAFAWSMFNVIAVYQLIMICIRWELDLMDNHHWSRFHMSDVILFLMKVSAAGIMLTFYNSPLPGFGVNFHQYANAIVVIVGADNSGTGFTFAALLGFS